MLDIEPKELNRDRDRDHDRDCDRDCDRDRDCDHVCACDRWRVTNIAQMTGVMLYWDQ